MSPRSLRRLLFAAAGLMALAPAAEALAEESGLVSELTVTARRDGYAAVNTSAAKIDAPLRDIPQTIDGSARP